MLLVRHAQSEWNALGRWQGQADPPLSDLGWTQARSAADRVGAVDVIVASPLQRAVATAQVVAEALGVGPVVIEPDLAERDAGEWSGLTRAEIEEAWPGYLAEGQRPPGFEGDASVEARALAALARVEDAYRGGDVLVVTHGGIIYTVEAHQGAPFERIPNLGARWLAHHGDRLELGERLLLVDEGEATTPAHIAQV